MSGWDVNTPVLVSDAADGWTAATVQKSSGIGSDALLEVRLDKDGTLVERRGAEVEIFDGAALAGASDMAALEALTEGRMLECLRRRYAADAVYTSVGGIVVAANPFRALPHLYDDAAVARFREGDDGALAAPHPFAIGEAALRALVRGGASQSVLISGESGAGKTETVKYVLRYLSRRSAAETGADGVDGKVLRSNPVLEAFANAKTTRNANSSRFGKYVHVYVDPLSGLIKSASISQFLLEKVRVVDRPPDERNYHAFYQWARGAQRTAPASFRLLAGPCVDVAGVDDAADWAETAAIVAAHGNSTFHPAIGFWK